MGVYTALWENVRSGIIRGNSLVYYVLLWEGIKGNFYPVLHPQLRGADYCKHINDNSFSQLISNHIINLITAKKKKLFINSIYDSAWYGLVTLRVSRREIMCT